MFCLPLGPQHKLWGKGVTFDIYTLALLNFERRMVWGYSSWCQIAQAPALADDDSHVRRDDGHEGDGEGSDGERDDMSVETASTEEDGDSSSEPGSEPGSENGEVAECISSSDEKTSSMPGGYDGPDPPMPVTGFASKAHFHEQCDNQLGCYSSSDSEPACEPRDVTPSSPAVSAAPENAELSREEKVRAFWSKYKVSRSKHMEPKPASSAPSSPSPEHVVSAGSHPNSDSDHLDSDTMRLSDTLRSSEKRLSEMKRRGIHESSDSDSDASSSNVSVKSAVNQATFDQAMGAGEGSKAASERRLSSASSKSTLETPNCSRPDSCL